MAINHAALSAAARVERIRAELGLVGAQLNDFNERMDRAPGEMAMLHLLEQAQYASGKYDGLRFALEVFED